MDRKLKKGGYAAILSIVVIAAVIVVNMIINKLPEQYRKWDMSSSKIYSVGDTAREVAASIDQDVTIYVVADPAKVDERISGFVNRFAALSDHILVKTVDTVLHPEELSSLEAENNSLLVECPATGKKESIAFADIIKLDEEAYYYYGQIKETEFDGEGLLTAAVSNVTSDVRKQVYQVKGHGELPLGETVLDLFGKSSLETGEVNLLTDGGIPEDCDLLIFNAPTKDLADDERQMVEDYLNQGGNVTVLDGYSKEEKPNFQEIYHQYGLNLEDGYAADTQSFYQNNPYFIFPSYNQEHEILEGISQDGSCLVTMAGAFTRTEQDDVEVRPFLETSDSGLLVKENNEQIQGTYILGATAVKQLESGEAKLTVFSAASLIDDGLNQTFTNLDNLKVFMNAVTWNFEDVNNVSIPSKSLLVTYNSIAGGGAFSLLLIVVIPAVSLGCGFMIWMKRRRL